MSLSLVPVTLAEANAIVRRWHRHNRPVPGHKFSIGATDGSTLRGVVIVGRPVARHFDDGETLEVVRVATDGTRNANSLLYGAARRAAFALGYRRLVTYTRTDESGASLRGAGFRVVAERQARSWKASSVARPRDDAAAPHQRLLWEVNVA